MIRHIFILIVCHTCHMEKATILVVDDDPLNLRLFLDQLARAGFKILVAPSGKRALQQIEHVKPDLILLDVMMPGIDGFETCVRLKADETIKDVPVIFMTALSDTLDKVKGFEVGGVDYITKPCQYEEVFARINTHLTIRMLQEQLKKQNSQLKELNASKDKFLSMISHDLRSPFSSLRGLIQFTAENIQGWNKAKIEDAINLVSSSTNNLYALIENLLTWSRIQRGVIEFQPQYVEIRKVIVQDVALFGLIAEQKEIALINCVERSLLAYGDINMIDAVLRNLISNALKFTHSGGCVKIAAAQENQFVKISVSDTGVGLRKENIAKLFRIDARYKQLGTAQEKGTGLGLILCREFVEKNGGEIGVESKINQGSTFFFTLPKIPLG